MTLQAARVFVSPKEYQVSLKITNTTPLQLLSSIGEKEPEPDFDIPQDLCELFDETKNTDLLYYTSEIDADIKALLDSPDEPFNLLPKKKVNPTKGRWNGINSYYAKISCIQPLSRQEEGMVFERYHTIKRAIKKLNAGDQSLVPLNKQLLALRNEIVERNCRFVVKLARTFWMDGNLENFENLISSGNIGLIRAVDKFDHKRGTRFLSYAAHWVALEIRNEISNSSLVRIPVWWQKTLKKLNDAQKELEKENEVISQDELATRSNIPLRLIAKAERSRRLNINHYPFSQIEISSAHSEHLITPRDSVERECFISDSRHRLDKMLGEINLKLTRGRTHSPSKFNAVDAIKSVYGLSEGTPQNLRQISNITSVCSERVRQLKEEGIRHLRKKMAMRGIRSVNDML